MGRRRRECPPRIFCESARADWAPGRTQDTFVVGCRFSDKIIYPETFAANPDARDPVYSTEYGVYSPHCGLENVMLSWGHDEVRSALCFFACFGGAC